MIAPDRLAAAGSRGPLSGQVALVTGASRGLGAAIATALARNGAAVAALARNAGELAPVVDAIVRDGGMARGYMCDVADVADMPDVVARVERELGAIRLLVNNAGMLGPIGPFADTAESDWWRVFEVNVRGAAAAMGVVVPRMMLRGEGRVVNVTSGAGAMGFTYYSAYVASKTALVRLTECAAAELAPYGVKVFSIEPGTVRTAMSLRSIESPEAQRWIPWFKGIFDHGLDASPDRVAQRVIDLALGKADALSGCHLPLGDDLEVLARDAERIRAEGKYVLGVQRLTPLTATNPALAKLRADGAAASVNVLQLRATLAISADKAFALWTEPAEIARWFLPLRVRCRHESLAAPSEVVMSWSWESAEAELAGSGDTRVTIRITPEGDGSEVQVTHEGFDSAQARDRHIAGWRACLSRMESATVQTK